MNHHQIESEEIARPITQEEGTVFRLLVEAMPLALFACWDGKIQYANPAGDALLGATEIENVIDRSFLQFVAPRDAEAVRFLLGNPEEAHRWRSVRIVRCNGKETRAELTAAPLADGCVLVIARKSAPSPILRFSPARTTVPAEHR